MKTFIQILAFSVIVIAGYSAFSNSIPQMRAEPPSEEEISLEGMTMESFAGLGEKIFHGKGTCPLCHNAVGHRAPLLEQAGADGPPVAARAADRLKGSRYKSKASTPEEYIRESMVAPSAFVVAGFGKAGTNDTVSPMPNVSQGSINLSEVEINAVIAYLQSAAGVEITVALPTGKVEVADEGQTEAMPVAKTMGEFAEKYECKVCHVVPGVDMGGEEPDIGPSLAHLATYKDKVPGGAPTLAEYIRQSILDPNRYVVEGFEADTMPDDLADRIRVSELEMAVNHLAGQAEGKR